MIRVEDVSKLHSGQLVLEDISFEVPEESYLGLVGPGGAGKSLMLKIISGLVEPDAGRVIVDGKDIHALSPTEVADLRFDIGMLFQNYALFDFMTVSENISFPLRQAGDLSEAEIEEEVATILEQIGLPSIGHQYPNELSGGMKKRVSFARAVIRRPPLLLYDDPTAGLDPVTSSKIFRLLKKLRHEYSTTAITVSHDIEGIKTISDKVVMLDRGQMRFVGSIDGIEACDDERVQQFWQGYQVDA